MPSVTRGQGRCVLDLVPRSARLLIVVALVAWPLVTCSEEPRQQLPNTDSGPRGRPRTAADAAPRARSAEADPAPLDRVLGAHVRDGRFDYAALAADAPRKADLDAFLTDVADERAPGLATLLNAYNAIVIRRVLGRFPVASVMDVPGFFDREKSRVGGREVTLNELEKEWILPEFRDARVHFALNCGARSCPPLGTTAFRAQTLDATLERMARDALASADFVSLRGDRVALSSLFDWYGADFVRASGSVVGFVRRYRPDVPENARVSFLRYDWRLNRP